MTAPEPASVAPPGCSVLEWDSKFFGVTIARLEPAALVQGGAALDWCAQAVDCGYLLADAADQTTIDAADAHGFRLVDVRLTLAIAVAGRDRLEAPPHVTIRTAAPHDLDALREIARAGHRDTRFYADGRFDPARCDEMYDVWITKSCAGWADRVIVAEVDGAAAGYVTCHRRDGHGEIGLVGVDARHRGAGLGMAMIVAALGWFQELGTERVTVVTQARNAAGLRLYQRAGFAVRSIELSFHKWWRT